MYDAIYAFSCRMQNIWQLCIHIRIFMYDAIYAFSCRMQKSDNFVYTFSCMMQSTHFHVECKISDDFVYTYAFSYLYLHVNVYMKMQVNMYMKMHMLDKCFKYLRVCVSTHVHICVHICVHVCWLAYEKAELWNICLIKQHIYMHFHLYIYMHLSNETFV